MHKKGFTIVELILVITLITMLFAISTPFFVGLNNRNDVNLTYNYLESSIRRSNQLAKSQYMNQNWGLYIDNINNKLIIYKGDDYLSRDISQDEEILVPDGISFQTDQDINFEQLSGDLSTSNIIITISKNGYTKDLNIANLVN